MSMQMNDRIAVASALAATAAVVVDYVTNKRRVEEEEEWNPHKGRVPESITIKRQRRNLPTLFEEIGPHIFRRMYRMAEFSFYRLFDLLEPKLKSNNKQRGVPPNGSINLDSRIAMALRWCAGGCKYDIATTHGVHPDEVYTSLWLLVDAIHATAALDIEFPSSHAEQQQMADDFRAKSGCGFWNCVGAVDGMLVWTCKPSEKADDMGIGPAKFFNGRKKKFGLQMQGTCGPNKKFLDVTCNHPGSASDFTMWLDSRLREKIETDGFLKEGLLLYGDNAYVNSHYVVSPFRQVSAGAKDAFNFYHSQLRITVEGAFGMLVQKWGCLRKPLPMNIPVSKQTRLVIALCKLHNFCIDQREELEELTVADTFNVMQEGGFSLGRGSRPSELLDGGFDNNDVAYQNALRSSQRKLDLPIYKMLQYIENNGYTRPPPEPQK
jgi:hypothetical protein